MKEEKRARIAYSIFFIAVVAVCLFGIYNYMSPSVDKVYGEAKELIDQNKFTAVEELIEDRYSGGIFFIDDINEKKLAEVEDMAVKYMEQVFYRKTGMSINDYISTYGNTNITQ